MLALNKTPEYDCILVGGGLQSGLLALAINQFHPDARVLMIERGPTLAGNHTWSFHPGDVPEDCLDWIDPLVQYRWSDYEVRLGGFRRRVELEYASIPSNHFAKVVGDLFKRKQSQALSAMQRVVEMAIVEDYSGSAATSAPLTGPDRRECNTHSDWQLLTNTEAAKVGAVEVKTRCGQTFCGELVIDCRGPSTLELDAGCGYQKFYGFELELDSDWPDENPTVMESVEDQHDGFRFLYTLPFERRRVMVEDTRFSDSPQLDRAECWEVVSQYVQQSGVANFRIVREESGVLPMPFIGGQEPTSRTPLAGGYAGGWFHAATGYSFPMAVAFAHAVASGSLDNAAVRVEQLSRQHRWRASYARFLNRLLFRLVTPKKRYRIFSRFYRVLNDEAVERFYSHQFGPTDAFRIVVGIPPTLLGLRPLRFLRSFLLGAER